MMTLRGSGGTGDTIPWPTGLLANPALRAGPPWPESIILTAQIINRNSNVHPKSPRGLAASAETCVEQVPRFSREPRKQRSKRALGRVTKLDVLLTDFQSNHDFAWLVTQFGLYFIAAHDNARLNLFDLRLHKHRPREVWDERSGLYIGP